MPSLTLRLTVGARSSADFSFERLWARCIASRIIPRKPQAQLSQSRNVACEVKCEVLSQSRLGKGRAWWVSGLRVGRMAGAESGGGRRGRGGFSGFLRFVDSRTESLASRRQRSTESISHTVDRF